VALKVLIADDHLIVRQGLRALLQREGLEVVGEATDGREAVHLAAKLRPDVTVLDLGMPQLGGLDAAREILREQSGACIILLTMHAEEHQISAALRAGIRGYVVKTEAVEDLAQAIGHVSRGGVYLSPSVSAVVVKGYLSGVQAPVDPLTPRERQVLQLVAEGRTSKEVATELGLTVKSAESYRTRIMDKLDIHDTAGLVRYAIRQRLVEP
jgi:DNA-binding NarL/FixJ family response regulator